MHDHFIASKFRAAEESSLVLAKNAANFRYALEYQTGTDLQIYAENLWKESLEVVNDVTRLLQALHDDSVWKPDECDGITSPFAVDVLFEQDPPCLHVTLDSPPVLKTRGTMAPYSEMVLYALQDKTIRAVPRGFSKWASTCVIYVNHTDATNGKAPYYDNDNVCIKAIMDAVVPHVCIDDAAVFCDNLYLYQEDSASFTELYIVPKFHFRTWIQNHQQLDFCQKLAGKFT